MLKTWEIFSLLTKIQIQPRDTRRISYTDVSGALGSSVDEVLVKQAIQSRSHPHPHPGTVEMLKNFCRSIITTLVLGKNERLQIFTFHFLE